MSGTPDPIPTFFLSLPTPSLPEATTFYKAIGFKHIPAWSDEGQTACFTLPAPNERVSLMVHTQAQFATFARPGAALADPRSSAQALFTVLCGSRDEVDAWLARVEEAGGKRDPYVVKDHAADMGMYSRSWEDVDGHVWEALCLLAGCEGEGKA